MQGVFHELARQKGCEIVSGLLAVDHVHMCITIPPKYAVAEVIGYQKGKSEISVARSLVGSKEISVERTAGYEAISIHGGL
jgi:putative transposase